MNLSEALPTIALILCQS